MANARTVNETRFQYFRQRSDQNGDNTGPTIQVLGAFTGGGPSIDVAYTNTNNYEFQNYTSITHGPHFTKFGIRVRGVQEANRSDQNFNGTFTFPTLASYQAGLPSQYAVTGGTPLINVGQVDIAPFIQDDWKVLPSVTLSLGLRYEVQNNIHDKGDWAPRVGVAWASAAARADCGNRKR